MYQFQVPRNEFDQQQQYVEVDGDLVLEEVNDDNYEPTEEEILEYAYFIGMDPVRDRDLLWIAREGLKAPLPPNWKPCQNNENEIYYRNFETGEVQIAHPCDEYYRDYYQKEKQKKTRKKQESSIPQNENTKKGLTQQKNLLETQKYQELQIKPQMREMSQQIQPLRNTKVEDPILKVEKAKKIKAFLDEQEQQFEKFKEEIDSKYTKKFMDLEEMHKSELRSMEVDLQRRFEEDEQSLKDELEEWENNREYDKKRILEEYREEQEKELERELDKNISEFVKKQESELGNLEVKLQEETDRAHEKIKMENEKRLQRKKELLEEELRNIEYQHKSGALEKKTFEEYERREIEIGVKKIEKEFEEEFEEKKNELRNELENQKIKILEEENDEYLKQLEKLEKKFNDDDDFDEIQYENEIKEKYKKKFEEYAMQLEEKQKEELVKIQRKYDKEKKKKEEDVKKKLKNEKDKLLNEWKYLQSKMKRDYEQAKHEIEQEYNIKFKELNKEREERIKQNKDRVNDMLKLRKERFKENFIKPVDALDSDRRNKIERLRELQKLTLKRNNELKNILNDIDQLRKENLRMQNSMSREQQYMDDMISVQSPAFGIEQHIYQQQKPEREKAVPVSYYRQNINNEYGTRDDRSIDATLVESNLMKSNLVGREGNFDNKKKNYVNEEQSQQGLYSLIYKDKNNAKSQLLEEKDTLLRDLTQLNQEYLYNIEDRQKIMLFNNMKSLIEKRLFDIEEKLNQLKLSDQSFIKQSDVRRRVRENILNK